MDVLGMHGEPTNAGGVSGETRVAVVVGRGEKTGLATACRWRCKWEGVGSYECNVKGSWA